MEKITHGARLERLAIERFIEKLLHLFMVCKEREEKIKKVREDVAAMDEANPEYCDLNGDRRENNRMLLYIIIACLSIFIDFFLLYNAISILCSEFDLPGFLKFVLPTCLVIVEIAISYFSVLKQRSGEITGWLGKYLPYFVIMILIAFSLLVILYALGGYNSQVDGGSYLGFLMSTCLVQIVLLIPSIMLHFWLIKNAEEIAEAIAYYQYKVVRQRKVNAIRKIEAENKKIYWRRFVEWVHHLVQRIYSFRSKFPGTDTGFERNMPADLVHSINTVMGRTVIVIVQESTEPIYKHNT